jgi:hypothetical protein
MPRTSMFARIVSGADAVTDSEKMCLIYQKAEADPEYNPYCLRCRGLVRMRWVAPFLWSCTCGAICDARNARPTESTP